MTKNNNIFSELYAEMGISTSTVVWMIVLNTVRTIAILVGVILVITWIVTQDSSFGWALIWPVVAVLLSNTIATVVAARMVLK